jgi:hypothetical protein
MVAEGGIAKDGVFPKGKKEKLREEMEFIIEVRVLVMELIDSGG